MGACFVRLQGYHPTRVFTLVYQPFALVTILVLTRYEARINTRLRILVGYTLFFIFVLLIPVVSVNNKSSKPHTLFLILTKLHDLTSQAIQDVWHRLVLFCYKYHRTPQFDLASHSRYTLSPCIVPLPQNPMIWAWSMSVFREFPPDRKMEFFLCLKWQSSRPLCSVLFSWSFAYSFIARFVHH